MRWGSDISRAKLPPESYHMSIMIPLYLEKKNKNKKEIVTFVHSNFVLFSFDTGDNSRLENLVRVNHKLKRIIGTLDFKYYLQYSIVA